MTLKFDVTEDADKISASQMEWDGKWQGKRVLCVVAENARV